MPSGIVRCNDLDGADFSCDQARQEFAELNRLRPYYEGDFYPLLPLSLSQCDWYAY